MKFIDRYKIEKPLIFSYDGLSGLFEITKNTEGLLEIGANSFSCIIVELYTPENAVIELFNNDFKKLPISATNYLFSNPFNWKVKNNKNGFVYLMRKGTGLSGILRKHGDEGHIFICRMLVFEF